MNQTEQSKSDETPVVSPLANDKTYGERVYSGVFDWGLNYWTNLLASAGFSHWAANTTQKVPFGKVTPRQLQDGLGEWISKRWFMNGYKTSQITEHGTLKGMENLSKRSFAMAESLTLLVPGFAVMIPSVWLGAKIKPMFVEWFNRRHYGDAAMDDPSLKARHQAIAAEECPTLLGTAAARMGTVGAVQLTAKFIGSESNSINWIGKKVNNQAMKEFEGINPVASSIGEGIGGAMPAALQARLNKSAANIGFSWSNQQLNNGARGTYNRATQDIMKYITMDTIYTLVSAGTIRPFLKLLKNIPFMSYKPRVPANSATFEGEKVKVPSNRYADIAIESLEQAKEEALPQTNLHNNQKPSPTVGHIHHERTLAEAPEPQLAGGVA